MSDSLIKNFLYEINNYDKNNDLKYLTNDFVLFCQDLLNIKKLPPIFIVEQIEGGTHGAYYPNLHNNKILVVKAKRCISDFFRSIAHELVHHYQNENDMLTINSGDTGSDIENEANYKAGIIIREYGRINPWIYTSY